jgi:hypothetical protein
MIHGSAQPTLLGRSDVRQLASQTRIPSTCPLTQACTWQEPRRRQWRPGKGCPRYRFRTLWTPQLLRPDSHNPRSHAAAPHAHCSCCSHATRDGPTPHSSPTSVERADGRSSACSNTMIPRCSLPAPAASETRDCARRCTSLHAGADPEPVPCPGPLRGKHRRGRRIRPSGCASQVPLRGDRRQARRWTPSKRLLGLGFRRWRRWGRSKGRAGADVRTSSQPWTWRERFVTIGGWLAR